MAAGKQATAAAAGQAHGLSPVQNAEFQDLFQTPSEEEIQQARADLAELGLSFESEADPPNNVRNSTYILPSHTETFLVPGRLSYLRWLCGVRKCIMVILLRFHLSLKSSWGVHKAMSCQSLLVLSQSSGPCSYQR